MCLAVAALEYQFFAAKAFLESQHWHCKSVIAATSSSRTFWHPNQVFRSLCSERTNHSSQEQTWKPNITYYIIYIIQYIIIIYTSLSIDTGLSDCIVELAIVFDLVEL